jgi:glycine/serine hydroxymethyltransferase
MFGLQTSKEVTVKDATVKASLSGVDITCRNLTRKGMSFEEFVDLIYPAIDAAANEEANGETNVK